MRILITGAAGMLGKALCRALSDRHEVHPTDLDTLDVTDLPAVREACSRLKPHWMIHAAAYTQVDQAETDQATAYRVNALGSRNAAVAAFEHQCALLYYSTDYVFNGQAERPYREWDRTDPLNEYGRSKLAGEAFVRSLCPGHLIVRTSWLFGPNGVHFVANILQRAQKQKVLEVVNDQRGSPTLTTDLAQMTLQLVERNVRGTYHVTNSGDCTWYEFARRIIALQGLPVQVDPTDSTRFVRPARRPAYSVLDNYMLKCDGIPLLPSWQDAVARFLRG